MKKKFLLLTILMIVGASSSCLFAQTDVTNLVGTSQNDWNGWGIYESSIERWYGNFPCDEHPLFQQITNLDAGVYLATLKATSNLAWVESDLVDGDASYAYVYATNGIDLDKSYFPAHRSTGVSTYYERSVAVQIAEGQTLEIGLGLDNPSLSNWHTIQIVSLIKYNSFDELVGPLKNPLKAKLDEVNRYITNSDDNPATTAKAQFQTAIDAGQAIYDSKTTYTDVVEAVANGVFEQAIADLEAAYEVYALSGAIPHTGYPFDITFKIVNPTFGNNKADGWTYSGAPGFQTYGNAEYFQANFDINQTITDMPQAKYLLKVKAFQRPGDPADVIRAYVAAEDNENGTFGVNAEIYVNNASQKIKNAASPMRTSALGKGGNESNVDGYWIPNDMNSADKYFIAEYYENEAEMICTTGTLKFGFRCSNGTGSKYWTIFDDFRLYLTDAIDLSVYQEELALAVSKATIQADRNIPKEVKDAINAVIDEYNKEWSTVDEYSTAIEAVNNSYTGYDMDALEEEYTAYPGKLATIQGYSGKIPNVLEPQIEALEDYDEETIDGLHAFTAAYNEKNPVFAAVSEAYLSAIDYEYESKYYDAIVALSEVEYVENTEGAYEDLEDAISSFNPTSPNIEELDNMETAEEINSYVNRINSENETADEELRDAGIVYAENADPTEGNRFDLTFMLTNANLEGLPTWQSCDGWFTDYPVDPGNVNSQVMVSNDVASDDGKNAFYEFWSRVPKSDNQFTLYQKVTLTEGIYDMSCLAFAQISGNRDANFTPEVELRAVKFFANDTEGSTIQTDKLAKANIEFVQESKGEVKIGLKVTDGNTYNWMGIGYVELYKLSPDKTIELSDADTNAPAAGAYTSIKYTRSLLEGLNTLVLPFQTTKEELGENVDVVLQYTGTTTEGNNITLNFSPVETLSPNVPYAIIMTASASLPVFENKSLIEPTDLTVTDAKGKFNFVGTYTCWTNENSPIVKGDFIAGANEFKKAKGGNALKAYRAYLKRVDVSDGANIAFNLNGEIITGIEAVELLNQMSGEYYNLNGQRVNNAQRGIFIKDGKKIVVK